MNRKVALVIPTLSSGGAEKLVYDTAIELRRRNVDVLVVSLLRRGDVYGHRLREAGIDVQFLSDSGSVYNPMIIFRLITALKGYSVIHAHLYAARLLCALISLISRRDRVFFATEHNTRSNRHTRPKLRVFDHFMNSRYKSIVAVSKASAAIFHEDGGPKEKMKLIYNGVNVNFFRKGKLLPRKDIHPRIKDTDVLVCMIARIRPPKDQATIVRALSLLEDKYKAVFIGEGDSSSLEALIKELALEERVFLLGFRSDTNRILKSSDISVLSSDYEGFGLVIVEAMAAGIPTINTNIEVLNEVVATAALQFKKGDAEDLSAKIKQLSEDKELYKQLVEKGEKRAEEFSIERMVDKHIALWDAVE